MKHLAKMEVVGNITEIKTLKVGKNKTTKVNFGVGVNKWKKNGDSFDKLPTIWIDCIAWGDTAKNILEMNIKKGSIVSLTGDYKIDIIPPNEKFPRELKKPIVWVNEIEVLTNKKPTQQDNNVFDFTDEEDDSE